MSKTVELWSAPLALAASQRGLITRRQLERAGVSNRTVMRLLSAGWLRRVRRGVYAIGGQRPSQWEDAIAVGLLAGEEAFLSHSTAAAIHGFPGIAVPKRVEFSVPGHRHPSLDGTTVHRVSRLDSCDVEERGGVRITTRLRTMVDIGPQLHPDLSARLIDEGTIARWWTAADLLRCIERVDPVGRGRARSLLPVLRKRIDEGAIDSILEAQVVRILAPYAPFEVHYELVLDGEVIILDIAWPQWLAAVEVDSWSIHGRSRSKFDHDRLHNNLLVAHGWRVARLTSAMNAGAILGQVGRLLPVEGLRRASR